MSNSGVPRRLRRALAGSLALAAGAAIALVAGPAPAGAAPRLAAGPVVAQVRPAVVGRSATIPWQNPSPYYEVSPTGVVWPLNGAKGHGGLPRGVLGSTDPVVSVTLTPSAGGYWLMTKKGQIYQFGTASFYRSPYSEHLAVPVVSLVSTIDGKGYWVFTSTGKVYNFGDALNFGSMKTAPGTSVVAMAVTPDGKGYWLVTATGAVANFGDAKPHGQIPSTLHLNRPVVGIVATGDGAGYWLVAADGGVFNFGDATYRGSLGGTVVNQPIQALVPTGPAGAGYWLVAHDGDLHPFGNADTATPPALAFVHTVQTAGDQALEWALAQIGKPYVWGGTGPGGFDCSGLTMMAWQAAGLAIPRIADEQYYAGLNVTLANLVDGDLVFWSSDPAAPSAIYHVAMYVGGGNIVQAPYTGTDVQTDQLWPTDLVPDGTQP